MECACYLALNRKELVFADEHDLATMPPAVGSEKLGQRFSF